MSIYISELVVKPKIVGSSFRGNLFIYSITALLLSYTHTSNIESNITDKQKQEIETMNTRRMTCLLRGVAQNNSKVQFHQKKSGKNLMCFLGKRLEINLQY